MNQYEWKNISEYCIPTEVYHGDFEFEVNDKDNPPTMGWVKTTREILLTNLTKEEPVMVGRYRQSMKQPTHEEIMTLWWEVGECEWGRVNLYIEDGVFPYKIGGKLYMKWNFSKLKSMPLPPEVLV